MDNESRAPKTTASAARIVPQARHCLQFATVTSEEVAASLIDRAINLQSVARIAPDDPKGR